MPETSDHFFLRPREVFSAKRVYVFDAINLVAYAKLPLKASLRGRQLIAGYVHCDGRGKVRTSMSAGEQHDLLLRYGNCIDALSYPVAPMLYEQLLDSMGKAGEKVLPYFFHDHHLMVDRRRRSAIFVRLYKDLQQLAAKGTVGLQLTDSEATSVLASDAWMTQKWLHKYLDISGVGPWWEDETNQESHAYLERILLSDWLSEPLQSVSSHGPAGSSTVPATKLGGYPPVGHAVSVCGATRSVVEDELPPADPALDALDALDTSNESKQADVRSAIESIALVASRQAASPQKEHEGTPEPVNLSSEAALPMIAPEHERYDERQLPSFLLAEKISRHSRFMRVAPQARKSSPLHEAEAMAPLPTITAKAATPAVSMQSPAPVTPVAVKESKAVRPTSSERPTAEEMTNPPNAVQAPTEPSLGHASAEPADDEMLTKQQVAVLLGLSTGTIDNYRKRPDFPKARVYGPTTIRWKRSEIRKWRERNPAL